MKELFKGIFKIRNIYRQTPLKSLIHFSKLHNNFTIKTHFLHNYTLYYNHTIKQIVCNLTFS